jgi:hypothetical protein
MYGTIINSLVFFVNSQLCIIHNNNKRQYSVHIYIQIEMRYLIVATYNSVGFCIYGFHFLKMGIIVRPQLDFVPS